MQTTTIISSRVRGLVVGLGAAALLVSLSGTAASASAPAAASAAGTHSSPQAAAKAPRPSAQALRRLKTLNAAGHRLPRKTARASLFYDGGRVWADSSWQGGVWTGDRNAFLLGLWHDVGVKSLNGGNQLVALRTDLVRNGTTSVAGRWYFAYATSGGALALIGTLPGYTVWDAVTNQKYASYSERTGFYIWGAGKYKLRLTVAWYAGSTGSAQRQLSMDVSINGVPSVFTVT